MSAVSLEHLLRLELEHLYSAELQTLERLPRLLATLTGPALKVALEALRWETETQLQRLDHIGHLLSHGLQGGVDKAARTLYREADRFTRTTPCGPALDGTLLMVFQRLSQRIVAGYGAARTYAQMLGLGEVAELLGHSLDEQSAAFRRLRELNAAQRLKRAAA